VKKKAKAVVAFQRMGEGKALEERSMNERPLRVKRHFRVL
jgi:hypothetical protein